MIHPNSREAYAELDISKRQGIILDIYKDGDPLIKLPHTKGRVMKARSAARAALPDDLKEAYGLSRGGKRQKSEYGY